MMINERTDPVGTRNDSFIFDLIQSKPIPGMISLASGYPSLGLIDVDGLNEARDLALADSSYLTDDGYFTGEFKLRAQIAEICNERGMYVEPFQLFVTSGTTQSLSNVVRTTSSKNDVIYLETPCCPITIATIRRLRSRIVEVPSDHDGIQTDILETMLSEAHREHRPKVLYCAPTYSNPSGTSLSIDRKRSLINLAKKYGFVIIEDDSYAGISFSEFTPTTLFSMGQRQFGQSNPVVYVSGLAMTVSPALHIGWLVANHDLLERLAGIEKYQTINCTPMDQAIAYEYFRLDRHTMNIKKVREVYRRRMLSLAAAIEKYLDDSFKFNIPSGGTYIWLRVGRKYDSELLLDLAMSHGVLYAPGNIFNLNRSESHYIRLSYASTSVDEIKEGIRRFTRAFSFSFSD